MMFNILNMEYRCVAGALYPPDDLLVTRNDQMRLIHMYNEPMSDPADFLGTNADDRLALAKKAMRKYLPEDEAKELDKLDTSRFLVPKFLQDEEEKKK